MASNIPAPYIPRNDTNYSEAIITADDLHAVMQSIDQQLPWLRGYDKENIHLKGENTVILKVLKKGQFKHLQNIAEYKGQICRPNKLEANDCDRQIVAFNIPAWVVTTGQIFSAIKGPRPSKATNIAKATTLITFQHKQQAEEAIAQKISSSVANHSVWNARKLEKRTHPVCCLSLILEFW
uniref:Uncharacterized protein n=1 Tax=Spongospora subterranea TaxID=70186 RepID=A0A0H5R9C5_9EUKA|eukprot:CRZ05014.1 hypothetical protein [Spongospora subterranea]